MPAGQTKRVHGSLLLAVAIVLNPVAAGPEMVNLLQSQSLFEVAGAGSDVVMALLRVERVAGRAFRSFFMDGMVVSSLSRGVTLSRRRGAAASVAGADEAVARVRGAILYVQRYRR